MDHPSGVLYALRNGRVTSLSQASLPESLHILFRELNVTMPGRTVHEHCHVRSRESRECSEARLGFPESASIWGGQDS